MKGILRSMQGRKRDEGVIKGRRWKSFLKGDGEVGKRKGRREPKGGYLRQGRELNILKGDREGEGEGINSR